MIFRRPARKTPESAGIGQDRFVPDHEFVESAHFLYDFISRAHMEVIGIGKFYLRADLLEIFGGNSPLIAAAVPTFINTGV